MRRVEVSEGKQNKGRNVIWVNGKPAAPLMYSGTEHSRETWAGQPRKSIEEFSALGYEIIQTDMWFKYSLRPDGIFQGTGRTRLCGRALAGDKQGHL